MGMKWRSIAYQILYLSYWFNLTDNTNTHLPQAGQGSDLEAFLADEIAKPVISQTNNSEDSRTSLKEHEMVEITV